MSLGVGSSTVTRSHTLRFPFTQKQQNHHVETTALGRDKVVLRDVRAISCVASESRAGAKLGGNFGKVIFNSWKPKGREKEVAPVCSLLLFGCSDLSDSCDPMGCSPLGSSVHGIFQARILERLLSPPPEDLPNPGIEPVSCSSCNGRQILYHYCHLGR